MSASPAELVERLERSPALPSGSDERFNGYGVMGLPFKSGHVLALRRFPATSVGPGYSSVWHRAPDGRWTFYADAAPRQSCTRYFGELASAALEAEIRLTWEGPLHLRAVVPAIPLNWEIHLTSTAATRLMTAAGRLLPEAAWRSPAVLAGMGAIAGRMLRVGRVVLRGRVPNGQRFIANPRLLWTVSHSRAVLAGEDLGAPGPVRPQAHLEEFWIPQRGMFAVGQARFESFDPSRHSARTSRSATETY